MKKITVIILLISSFSSLLFTGCGSKNVSKNQTMFFSLDAKQNATYYTGNHPEVIAAKNLAEDYAEAIEERDYTKIDGKAEYHLYTNAMLDKLAKANDEQNTVKVFKDFQIKSKYDGCEFVSIKFNSNFAQAEITYKVSAHITAASDAYFKAASETVKGGGTLKKDTVFEKEIKLIIRKENNNWKVDDYAFAHDIVLKQ